MEKWYSQGLNFKCTGCGKCCTGSPGYVWVNEEEVKEMAGFLKISISEFYKKYVRKVEERYSLIENRKSYDCVFLENKQCKVYGARPTQCKTFPFWPQNLTSKEVWDQVRCEGISEEAPIVEYETIEKEKLIQIKRNN